jgi:hypothetical protein
MPSGDIGGVDGHRLARHYHTQQVATIHARVSPNGTSQSDRRECCVRDRLAQPWPGGQLDQGQGSPGMKDPPASPFIQTLSLEIVEWLTP